MQNVFHFLCEKNNGQVPLPISNSVSTWDLSLQIYMYKCLWDKLQFFLFILTHWKHLVCSYKFLTERRSMESVFYSTSSWNSEWVCHAIWYWKYLPSNDVSPCLVWLNHSFNQEAISWISSHVTGRNSC